MVSGQSIIRSVLQTEWKFDEISLRIFVESNEISLLSRIYEAKLRAPAKFRQGENSSNWSTMDKKMW